MTALALSKPDADWLNLVYLLAAMLFIFGLKMLGNVRTARKGNLISAVGMLIACAATFFKLNDGEAVSLIWIVIAVMIGTAAGVPLALKMPMTAMPQMVALFNGFGGIASLLVAVGTYARKTTESSPEGNWNSLLATGLAVLIGGATFTGSLVAFGKLQGLKITPGRPIQFAGQKLLIALVAAGCLVMSGWLVADSTSGWTIGVNAVLALTLGILLVIGIGGADMPVVVSLLNSYSGLAAAMAGFVLSNNALIITGALVGASGIILTNIMCKAMNRSLVNVLFGGVGGGSGAVATADSSTRGRVREYSAEDVSIQLDAAGLVIIVPGYGMAVAQAQHSVKDLASTLEDRGISVRYAIHPVAGRMPGHMNVLLAEAGVDYEQLCDMQTINPEFEQAGVALVIGANDVTNPAARHTKDSPIYGMPILDVDKARSVVVIKRSLNPGFAGVENDLYYQPNCGMLFGDAKKMVNDLVASLKES